MVTDESLFMAALEISDPEERALFLASACTDTSLRRQVEELLAAHQATSPLDGQLLASPLELPTRSWVKVGDVPKDATRDDDMPRVIAGRFQILDLLGQGGMATVYRALQLEPIKRHVAVKVIKAGMDSKQVLARFDAERQALALMDHPNIAKVLDGGLDESRPYFVMELVKGVPITEYCDQHKLSIQQRLELFLPVCQALQHAHQKGIIHRDIKPSNIIVAEYDDKPVPKVIDFGVAKAVGGVLNEQTMYTGLGHVVGTPQYMSPEQATFNNLDIDTRSDVYALGVLLYELLTGSPPFARTALESKNLLEILRMVREDEPVRPSARLSTAESLPTLSANRSTETRTLTGLLRNELDWIVMKALEKDRTQRYDSAQSFAADVQRYLDGEAVMAHPPSATYQLKKFVRRHRGRVIAAGLVFGALLAGIFGTSWGMVRAENARSRADAERNNALLAANEERLARQSEERERKYAEAIAAFVKDDFLALTSVEGQDRFGGDGLDRNSTLIDLLNRAAGKLKQQKQLEPRIEAELCWIVGVNYRGAGQAAKGIPFLERSVELRRELLGNDHPETLNTLNSLGRAYIAAGLKEKAVTHYKETYQLTKTKLGTDHAETLINMNNLADSYRVSGLREQAMPLLLESVALHQKKYGTDHAETLRSMNNLAVCLWESGQSELALQKFEEILALRKAKLGANHPDTLTSMNNLAVSYKNSGKVDLALKIQEEAFTLRKTKLGPDHPDTLISMNNWAGTYAAAGKLDLALKLFEEAFTLRKAKLGPDHPDTLISMNNLAATLHATGKLDQVPAIFEEMLKLVKAKHGSAHPETTTTMAKLAMSYDALKQYDKAETILRERLLSEQQLSGNQSSAYASACVQLAYNLMNQQKWADAETLLRECLAIRRAIEPEVWTTFYTMSMFGSSLSSQGKHAEAEPLLLQGYEGMKARAKLMPPQAKSRLLESVDRLLTHFRSTMKPDEVTRWGAVRASMVKELRP